MQAPFAQAVLFISSSDSIHIPKPNITANNTLRLNTTIQSSPPPHTTTNTNNMARGEATKIKVHFKGTHDDFIVFVDDAEVYHQWMTDKSVPLAHFISTFKVFATGQ